ncbi:MAG: hypothetical protein GC186_10765 [Rhodobacteraceae bacterium]|nr:hypothetical protein [Paracoccaceae bacterium]
MIRVQVIGNSHVGALHLAWQAAAVPGIEMRFFAASYRPGYTIDRLNDGSYGLPPPRNRAERAVAEGAARLNDGATSIRVDDMDAVVFAGHPTRPEILARLLAQSDIDGLRATGADTLLSVGLFDDICAALARAALPAPHPAATARPRQIILPRPAQAATLLLSANPGALPWKRLAENPEGVTGAFTAYDRAMTAAMADHGLTYLPQPRETRTPEGLTDPRFLADPSAALPQDKAAREDHSHMGADYGAICLDDIAAALTGAETRIQGRP